MTRTTTSTNKLQEEFVVPSIMMSPTRVVVIFLLVFLLFRDEQQQGLRAVSSFSSVVSGRYRYSSGRNNRAAFREAISSCSGSSCRTVLAAYSESGGNETPKHDDNDHAKAVIPPSPSSSSSSGRSVTLKLAMDGQGGVADMSSEKSERFTCSESLDMVHRLRRVSDAVLVGRSTVQDDDCTLTVRRVPPLISERQQPIRVIIDPTLQLQLEKFKIASDGLQTVVIHADFLSSSPEEGTEEDTVIATISHIDDFPNVTFVGIPLRQPTTDSDSDSQSNNSRRHLSAKDICQVLAEQFDVHHLMVEGGPNTARQFLQEGVVDRAIIVTAPMSFVDPLPSNIHHQLLEESGLQKLGHASIGDDTIEYFSRPELPWPTDPVTSWP